MNDDELSRRLRDELPVRIQPPDVAPEVLVDHLRRLQSRQPARTISLGLQRVRLGRDLVGLAAVLVVCALVAAGLFFRQSAQPQPAASEPKAGIEVFGRIDARTAWAESGSDLYITRDGGATWSKGTVPGGLSPALLFHGDSGLVSGASGSTYTMAPGATQTPPPLETMSGHYYPDFIDADHGWLLSWMPSSGTSGAGTEYAMTAWRTVDGGRHWESASLPGKYKGQGIIQFVDASHGWVTILNNTADPIPSDATTILATTDGGVTWQLASTMAASAVLRFVSPTEGWGYAATTSARTIDAIVHSTDGGRTWTTAELALHSGPSLVRFADPPTEVRGTLTARLAWEQPGSLKVLTFVSTDDGRTWTETANPAGDHLTTGSSMNSAAMVLSLPIGQPFAMTKGEDPNAPTAFEATFDGGATWRTYSTGSLAPSGFALAEWT
jgi:photosystem II stability/assembly factor-like uncharacterized protein